MTRIALIGYRCTGKSSAGEKLAHLAGLDFYDTDRLIMDVSGSSIKDIVSAGGWMLFREIEEKVIGDIASLTNVVIALGGGALDSEINRTILLKNNFHFVWLTAQIETIMSRMRADGDTEELRPALMDHDRATETREMLSRREPLYRGIAGIIVDTSHKSIDTVAEELYHHIIAKD